MFKPRQVTIIGGYGLMGQWFARFFISQGCRVVISGRSYQKCKKAAGSLGAIAAKGNADAINGSELVVLSVMPQRFAAVAKSIAGSLAPKQIVIDVTSVKENPVKIMHKYLKGNLVLGTHPMFGPLAQAKGQNFILTPTSRKERAFAREFSRYLRSKGFNAAVMSPKEHDRMIGDVLSLTHFVGFVTADAWKSLRIHRFIGTSSTSFRLLKSFVQSIVDSNPELYSYLQVGVTHAYGAERLFARKSMEWSDLVRRKKGRKLSKKMAALSRYVSGLK
jgi:prephenate dehydrogenase